MLMQCGLLMVFLHGCAATPPTSEPVPASTESHVSLEQVFVQQEIRPGMPGVSGQSPEPLPPHLNSPMASARELATMPPLQSRDVDRMVRLHAKLYWKAMDLDQWRRSAYLLLPGLPPIANEGVQAMPEREFSMRVLAMFINAGTPVAWDTEAQRARFNDRHPRGPAGHIWFEITHEDLALATVEADVCVRSQTDGSMRVRVEAVYDGEDWATREIGARTSW